MPRRSLVQERVVPRARAGLGRSTPAGPARGPSVPRAIRRVQQALDRARIEGEGEQRRCATPRSGPGRCRCRRSLGHRDRLAVPACRPPRSSFWATRVVPRRNRTQPPAAYSTRPSSGPSSFESSVPSRPRRMFAAVRHVGPRADEQEVLARPAGSRASACRSRRAASRCAPRADVAAPGRDDPQRVRALPSIRILPFEPQLRSAPFGVSQDDRRAARRSATA